MRITALPALLSLTATAAWGSPLLKMDGSSTVYPIAEAIAEEYQLANPGKVRVTVGISGTGGGFKKFCRGETDVQNASRPILANEMEACRKAGVRYFEIPLAFDAIAVVVNRNNDWLNEITVEELKRIWEPSAQGRIKTWKQVNPAWPDVPLTLYGPGADSGTFDYFTEAIMGEPKACRGDYTASEDDNTLVLGVSNDRNALGYFGLAYYEGNKDQLKLVPVVGGPKSPKKNKAVFPTKTTVLDGSYYPLSRPVFIYLSEASLRKPEVKQLADFYFTEGGKLAEEVGFLPLAGSAYRALARHLSEGKVGTVFGGHPGVGVTIEELLKREATL